ncbi:MAG: hypothetical protein GXP26_10225 [Planctomycetes bacterium]|nr:hypothetical protein [Planctomycetota bacterium]
MMNCETYRYFLTLILLATLGLGAAADAMEPEPPSPPPNEWAFVDALSAPLIRVPHWSRDKKRQGEASLQGGVRVETTFPDPEGILETAYQDLDAFFDRTGISTNGPYRIVTEKIPTQRFETFKLTITENECRIQANDTEGIRRGIFFLQDELMRAEGPFLAIGEKQRSPFIHTRISRCFFGPIKRPPKNKDELLDDVDYYPGEYLNRLAHDGVNGLWLTIEFKNICKTSLTQFVDPDRDRRLAKLRKTVAKCRRYGIKVFVFCIEPRAMSRDNPLLKDHPELAGETAKGRSSLFCPFSEAAQTYLYEAMHDIFSEVPNLGGLIDISFGERATTCLSVADEQWQVPCLICGKKPLGDILNASLSAMQRGMHAANPNAKLISWLYVPENGTGVIRDSKSLIDIARRTPPGVICQYNFESGGTKMQLGKERHAGDYWLSYVGPSDIFKNVAAAVAEGGAEMAAKLQACNSFEVSTVPYVPVPSKLYQKYREMRRLGITTVMQCWYIGNMPSVMNWAAASELPFSSKELTEDEFLLELARRDWGPGHAPSLVRAWQLFEKAYDNYPLTNAFQYYGPMHDGIVWPLYLKPVHKNLSPIWKLEFPPSGDRIGECFSGTHTFDEALELCRRMSGTWQEGLEILQKIKPQYANDPARLRDITVAEALGLHFRSGYNILRFYNLRERLLYETEAPREDLLKQLQEIVEEEIENSTTMATLCESNPFLGFQAEAEGYKYFPAKLRWRVGLLQNLLNTELKEAARAVVAGEKVFPELSGLTEGPLHYSCEQASGSLASDWQNEEAWSDLPRTSVDSKEQAWSWQAAHDDGFLYVNVESSPSEQWRAVDIAVHVEATHVYPRRIFRADLRGKRPIRTRWLGIEPTWDAKMTEADLRQTFRLRIPLDTFEGEADLSRPMRFNIEVTFVTYDKKKVIVRRWVPRAEHRIMRRLGYAWADPAEMGWLLRQ